MSACAECRQLIYGSVSIDALADGLNARTLREMGKRRQMRFRGVDAFDLMHWCVRGLPPSVQVGKWCAMPDLDRREILVLALRAQGYGQKAIAERAGFVGKGQAPQMRVRNFIGRLGLPSKLKFEDSPKIGEIKAETRRREWRKFVLGTIRWAQRKVDAQTRPGGELFIGPTIPAYWVDADRSRKRSRESAKRTYWENKGCVAYELPRLVRTRISNALKRGHAIKHHRALKLLGCDVVTLRRHIEGLFADGMGWHNRGDWHIDHIVPIAAFNLNDPQQQMQAFHYTNLQPLWAVDNWRKNSRPYPSAKAIRRAYKQRTPTPPRRGVNSSQAA